MIIVGEGSVSKIYKTYHNNNIIVLKKPYADEYYGDDKSNIYESFEREIKFFKEISKNKFIVDFLGTDENNILLEYLPCGNLYDKILEFEIDSKIKKLWFNQILEGLYYIHLNNYAHGDINPSNILIDINNNIKLCDFGKSVKLNEKPLLGTPEFCSYELITNISKSPDKCDIYALGITVIFIVTKKTPIEFDNEFLNNIKEKKHKLLDQKMLFYKYINIMIKDEDNRPTAKELLLLLNKNNN